MFGDATKKVHPDSVGMLRQHQLSVEDTRIAGGDTGTNAVNSTGAAQLADIASSTPGTPAEAARARSRVTTALRRSTAQEDTPDEQDTTPDNASPTTATQTTITHTTLRQVREQMERGIALQREILLQQIDLQEEADSESDLELDAPASQGEVCEVERVLKHDVIWSGDAPSREVTNVRFWVRKRHPPH